ncbi:hypothetical protein [Providencia vermicola]|uniref:hypothetical protein n=1 Tax=Providencia vermicola TaxID=333965 RepID=UPI003D2CF363
MSLAIIILLIILVPAIPFFCLLKKRKWKFWLDESSLHVQPLFWFLVFLPLIISGIAWVLIAQDYELDVSAKGYSRLMENAKFPFLILTLSPILGAFVTSAHRSLQTAKQIEIANVQLEATKTKNKVDKFYSDKKDLYELIGYLRSCNGEKILNVGSILFKAFDIKNYEKKVNDDFIELINKFIASLSIYMDAGKIAMEQNYALSNYGNEDFLHSFRLYRIEVELIKIKKYFHLEIKDDSYIYNQFRDMLNNVEEQEKKINEASGNEEERSLQSQIRSGMFGQFNVYLAEQLYDAISIINELTNALYMDLDIEELFPDLRLVISKGNDLNLLALDL